MELRGIGQMQCQEKRNELRRVLEDQKRKIMSTEDMTYSNLNGLLNTTNLINVKHAANNFFSQVAGHPSRSIFNFLADIFKRQLTELNFDEALKDSHAGKYNGQSLDQLFFALECSETICDLYKLLEETEERSDVFKKCGAFCNVFREFEDNLNALRGQI
jgi:hypothetical protein